MNLAAAASIRCVRAGRYVAAPPTADEVELLEQPRKPKKPGRRRRRRRADAPRRPRLSFGASHLLA